MQVAELAVQVGVTDVLEVAQQDVPVVQVVIADVLEVRSNVIA